jgi:hypothetical protein
MWVYGYHAKTKQKTSHWKTSASPNPKRAWQMHSQLKDMLLVFFYQWGIVHYKVTPEG